MNKWIELKVPNKYKSKAHTIRRYINEDANINVDYVYVAYLTHDYWKEFKGSYVSTVSATSKEALFRLLEKL